MTLVPFSAPLLRHQIKIYWEASQALTGRTWPAGAPVVPQSTALACLESMSKHGLTELLRLRAAECLLGSVDRTQA